MKDIYFRPILEKWHKLRHIVFIFFIRKKVPIALFLQFYFHADICGKSVRNFKHFFRMLTL